MIRKLQKKFISISALGLFLLILFVTLAINVTFFYRTNQHLESRLSLIMGEQQSAGGKQFDNPAPDSPPPGNPAPDAPPSDNPAPDAPAPDNPAPDAPAPGSPFSDNPAPDDNAPSGLLPLFENRLRIQSDGCLIFLDESGNVTSILQDVAERYSEDELTAIAAALLSGNKTHGWYQYFKFRMETQQLSDGTSRTVIGLINASSDLYSAVTVVLSSLIIGLLSFAVVLFIIVLASKRAVKPVAESYSRQKQFITDAGHELKTPLTVISANSELARMIYGDSEWFDSIDKQVAKMNSLVRSLISLAKMDEEQKPVFTTFCLSDAVYDTAKSFENLLHSKGKLLTLSIAENITYVGDESRIRQVISILMDNAAKYCDENGKVAVRLENGRQLRIQVINDFADVDSCELDKLFERFYRADKARTSDGSYGLGLSIAKSIVEQHGGSISARSAEHGRVVFEIVLPKTGRK